MAQSGFTPISLYYSSTPGAIPTATDLVNGELGLNIADGAAYYKDATGTVERLNSGSGPTFNATGTTLQVVPTNTFTKIEFDSVAFDSSLSYDPVLYRFTAPTKGYYQVNASIVADVATSGQALISIYKNGARLTDGNAIPLNSTQQIQLVASTILYLNGTGDYIEVWAEQTSGANLQMGAPGPYTSFSAISYGIPGGFAPTPTTYPVTYLIVGGGGGALDIGSSGIWNSGGGGGGQVLSSTSNVTRGVDVLTITVGGGGAPGSNGTNSSIAGIATVIGGYSNPQLPNNPAGGTSGNGYQGGAGIGDGTGNNGQGGGGAGGASGNGGNAYTFYAAGPTTSINYAGGAGGPGIESLINGVSEYYGGGGGGGAYSYGGVGGTGGGGRGNGNQFQTNGLPNTGGGGGGVYGPGGSNGGSGIVVIAMPTASYTGTVTGSPTITTVGSNTILTFTQSGSYTA